jgi:pimeloyl-ACP methyl ester carboxylesterase
MTSTTTTYDVHGVPVQLTEIGEGRPILVLHGGGGPGTVLPWAARVAETQRARVLVPVHPGFNGTVRPESVTSVRHLARLAVDLLALLDLHDVIVVGNSIGGWVAAEIAAIGSSRISGVVIVDGVGLVVEGHPYPDFFGLTPREIAEHSYHDPDRFGVDPAALPPEARAVMIGNRVPLGVYGGDMTDPTLADRLASISVPALVVWGAADRIGDPEVGRAYAELIPGARFELIAEAGHLPQIETPDVLDRLVASFADEHAHA